MEVSTIATLVAAATSLFLGLLPITHTSWKRMVTRQFEYAYRTLRTESVGMHMLEKGADTIHFVSGYGFRRTNVDTKLSEPSTYVDRLAKHMQHLHPAFVRNGPIDPDSRVLQGLNELASKTFYRGYKDFKWILMNLSLVLSFVIVTMAADFDAGIMIPGYVGVFIISLLSFIVYAIRSFTDDAIRWWYTWTENGVVFYTDNRLWEGAL